FGGVLASFLIYFYMIDYVKYVSPDIITFFLNFFIIYLHILVRKNLKHIYLFPLAILLGISFLFKASLVIYLLFLIPDLLYCNRNQLKHVTIKIFVFSLVFLAVWVPYNLWSINYTKQAYAKTSLIFELNYNEKSKLNIINSTINNNNLIFLKKNITLSPKDLQYFHDSIKPGLSKTYAINLKKLHNLPYKQQLLSLLYTGIQINDNYFIIKLPPGNRLMDVNNEYILKDGRHHTEWVNDENSFYNLNHSDNQSDLKSVFEFYKSYPQNILKIPNKKLQTYYSGHTYTLILGLMLLFYSTTLVLSNYKKSRKNYISMLYIFSFLLTLLAALLFSTNVNHCFAILIILLILFDKTIRKVVRPPVFYIILTAFIFPIITYGDERFIIYYDTYPIILIGIFLILTIHKIRELIESRWSNFKINN
ncbi:MAG: hypothetical protein ACP5DZ_02955, partial [Bacteroidales bacterium]